MAGAGGSGDWPARRSGRGLCALPRAVPGGDANIFLAMAAPHCVAGHVCTSSSMFSVTEADAITIRDTFHQRGEHSAVIELRRLFPGVTDNRQAWECGRMIAGWGRLSRRSRQMDSGTFMPTM